jgi:hypothetical protein
LPPSESVTLATFTDGAPAPHLLRYTKDLADAGAPPAEVAVEVPN